MCVAILAYVLCILEIMFSGKDCIKNCGRIMPMEYVEKLYVDMLVCDGGLDYNFLN